MWLCLCMIVCMCMCMSLRLCVGVCFASLFVCLVWVVGWHLCACGRWGVRLCACLYPEVFLYRSLPLCLLLRTIRLFGHLSGASVQLTTLVASKEPFIRAFFAKAICLRRRCTFSREPKARMNSRSCVLKRTAGASPQSRWTVHHVDETLPRPRQCAQSIGTDRHTRQRQRHKKKTNLQAQASARTLRTIKSADERTRGKRTETNITDWHRVPHTRGMDGGRMWRRMTGCARRRKKRGGRGKFWKLKNCQCRVVMLVYRGTNYNNQCVCSQVWTTVQRICASACLGTSVCSSIYVLGCSCRYGCGCRSQSRSRSRCACVHMDLYERLRLCAYTCVYLCSCAGVHVCVRLCTCVCTCVRTCVYVPVNVKCTHVYIYVHLKARA